MTTLPSHSHPKGLKKFLALLLLPALLFLTACEISMHTKFHENNTAEIRTEMKFSEEETNLLKMSGEEVTCEALMKEASTTDSDVEYTYEDLSTDSALHCVGSIPPQPIAEAFSDDSSGSVTNENGVYTVVIPGEDVGTGSAEADAFAEAVTFSAVFEFPGDVIEASAGTIEGNKVTFTDPTALNNDITIKAHSTTGGPGSSILMWVLIGVGALLLLGLILWLVLRGKKGNQEQPPAGPGYPGNYGQPAPHQPGQPQGGFQPQPGQQPGQPNQYRQQQGYGQPAPGQQGYGHPGQQPPAQQGNPQGYQPRPGQGQPHPPQPGQPPQGQRPHGQPQPPREGEPPTPPQQ